MDLYFVNVGQNNVVYQCYLFWRSPHIFWRGNCYDCKERKCNNYDVSFSCLCYMGLIWDYGKIYYSSQTSYIFIQLLVISSNYARSEVFIFFVFPLILLKWQFFNVTTIFRMLLMFFYFSEDMLLQFIFCHRLIKEDYFHDIIRIL